MNNVLIYDIECATFGNSVREIEKHKLRYFGAYSYKTRKFYFYTKLEDMQDIISSHKIIVGFNNVYYDNPILFNHGINYDYKIVIDLYKIMEGRAGLIPHKGTFLSYHLKNYTLDAITRELELVEDGSKKDIDYKMFDIENPTKEQLEEIKEYTIRDIEITKKLFDYVLKTFEGWKAHLSKKDVLKLKHISVSPSVYAYKVLAERCGFNEEYRNVEKKEHQGVGGYVSYPAAEKVEGKIYCLDFSSLYPHIMVQCNLYGRNKDDSGGWHGNEIITPNGYYSTSHMHVVSKVLMDIYKERKELKRNKNPNEYGLKIVLNTTYGILRNPVFTKVYDNVAGEDCCIIGQQFTKYARKIFKEEGYAVIYTDTDSVYIEDKFNDKERMLKVRDKIISSIKSMVPFPVDTFNMGIDYEIDMIHFFKGGHKKDELFLDDDDIENQKLGLMKKNYLFVYRDSNNNKKVFIKNLGIVKRTCSQISKRIFWDKMVPKIIETNNCKFDNNQILEWINELVKEDITLIAKRMNIQEKRYYKSESSIQVQAFDYIPTNKKENLGPGIHYFIPNKRIGFGKGEVKYCTIEEYNEHLTVEDLFLHGIMRELRYFNNNYKEPNTNTKYKGLKHTTIQNELW